MPVRTTRSVNAMSDQRVLTIPPVPITYQVRRGSSEWQLFAVFDQRRAAAYDASWLKVIRDHHPRMHFGEVLAGVDIGGSDGYRKLSDVRVRIAPSYVPITVTVRVATVVSGRQRWKVGTLPAFSRSGALFDADQMLLPAGSVIHLNTWYYTVRASDLGSVQLPNRTDCRVRVYPDTNGWMLIGFQIITMTSQVGEFLARIGFDRSRQPASEFRQPVQQAPVRSSRTTPSRVQPNVQPSRPAARLTPSSTSNRSPSPQVITRTIGSTPPTAYQKPALAAEPKGNGTAWIVLGVIFALIVVLSLG